MKERTPKRTPPDEIFKRIKEEIGNCAGRVDSTEISGRINKCKAYVGSFLKSHPEFQLEAGSLIKNRRQQLAQEKAEMAAGATEQPIEAAYVRPEDVLRQILKTIRKKGTVDYTNTSRAMGRDMNFVGRFAHANPQMREAIDRMIEKRKPDAEKEGDALYVENSIMQLIPNSREVPTWRYLCRESVMTRDRCKRIETTQHHMERILEKCRERIAKMPSGTFFSSVKHWYVEIFNPAGNKEKSKPQGEAEKSFRKNFDAGIREAAVERLERELAAVALEGNVEPDSLAAARHLGMPRSLVLKFLGETEGALEEIIGRVARSRAPAQETRHIARRVDTWRGRLFVTEIGSVEQRDGNGNGKEHVKRHFVRSAGKNKQPENSSLLDGDKPPEEEFNALEFLARARKQIEASPEIGYARNALHLLGASRTNPAIELGSRILFMNGEAAPSLNVAQVAAGKNGAEIVASMQTIGEATLFSGCFGCAVSIMGYDVLDKSGREFLFECANAALEKGGKFAVVSEWPVRMRFEAFGFEPAIFCMFNENAMLAVFEKTQQVRVRREPELEAVDAGEKLRIMRMCGRSFNPHSREDVLRLARAARKKPAALVH